MNRAAGRRRRNPDFVQVRQRRVDDLEVAANDVVPLVAVALLDGVLDAGDRLIARQDAGDGEEAGLQHGVDPVAEAPVAGDLGGVDHVEAQLLGEDLRLQRAGQVLPHLVRAVLDVEQEGRPGRGLSQHVDPSEKARLVAGDEVGRFDQVRRVNRPLAEAQVRDRLGAGLVRVVDEVALRVHGRIFGDDLDAVLVGADRAVGAETEEQGAHDIVWLDREPRIEREVGLRDVVVDPDGEAVPGVGVFERVEHRLHLGRAEVLGAEPVTPADHPGHRVALAAGEGLGQRRRHVEVERLARRARFLGLLEHRERPARLRQRGQERLGRERAVEAHLQHADPGARLAEDGGRLARGLRARAHQHDHPFGVGGAFVLEELVGPAGERREPVHGRLHDARRARVIGIHGLARLKERVRVVRGAPDERMLGIERALAVRPHQILPDHRPDLGVGQQEHLVELVRGPEPVEEMQERDARLQRGRLRDQGGVVRLLHRRRRQQGEPGRAGGHHVRVVAEDRQRLRRQRAGRHVKDRGGQLARDLEHVGQHQHEPLRRREGGRHGARLERPVHGPGGAALALHLLDDRDVAPDVGQALRRPLVGQLGHPRRRGDRVDRADLVHAVGDVRDGAVAVDGDRARRVGLRAHL